MEILLELDKILKFMFGPSLLTGTAPPPILHQAGRCGGWLSPSLANRYPIFLFVRIDLWSRKAANSSTEVFNAAVSANLVKMEEAKYEFPPIRVFHPTSIWSFFLASCVREPTPDQCFSGGVMEI